MNIRHLHLKLKHFTPKRRLSMNEKIADILKATRNYNPEIREKFIQMSTDEKRTFYKCRDNYNTIGDIVKLKDMFNKRARESTCVSSSTRSSLTLPALSVEEAICFSNQISIWQGDITSLEVDAIVNAGNESLLGGGGVDGAIHNAASKLLLRECRTLHGCKTGQAKITAGYCLPAKYVIHTVGPKGENQRLLQSAYKSCLDLMESHNLSSIGFPCISTGIYGYPNEAAAKVAIETVLAFIRSDYGKSVNRIVFAVFLDKDVAIYEGLMRACFELLK